MIPFFTTDASIGRSILKLNDIKDMANEAGLDEVFLIEDSMINFQDAFNTLKDEGLSLRFGLRINVCNDRTEEKKESSYKIILSPLNDMGCKQLYQIFTKIFSDPANDSHADIELLRGCNHSEIAVMHPFYDSYLYNNAMYFKNCMWDSFVPEDREIFLLEENAHPHDALIKQMVMQDKKRRIQLVKSIFYRLRSDVEAYQTYRMSTQRSFGRVEGLTNPNIEHFGSREFCFQSYMDYHGKTVKI